MSRKRTISLIPLGTFYIWKQEDKEILELLPSWGESECAEHLFNAWKLPVWPPKGQRPVCEFPWGPGITGEPLLWLVVPAFHHQRSWHSPSVFICSSHARWSLEGGGGSWQLCHLSVHCSLPILAWSSSSSGRESSPSTPRIHHILDMDDVNHCSERASTGASSIEQHEARRRQGL